MSLDHVSTGMPIVWHISPDRMKIRYQTEDRAIIRKQNRLLVLEAKRVGPEELAKLKKAIAAERLRLAWHANRTGIKERRKQYRESPRGKEAIRRQRKHDRMRELGLTPDEFAARLEAQGGVCAICRSRDVNLGPGGRLMIDHDHVTGRVRGLLCGACNTWLGVMGDNLEGVARRIESECAAALDLLDTLERFVDYLDQ